jgi:3D-(3,5/4)-trihydroxycyclohexane-1,2-dione acylhydrolase (decyclizing)
VRSALTAAPPGLVESHTAKEEKLKMSGTYQEAAGRAAALAEHGSLQRAVEAKAMRQYQDVPLSEALVLGLFNQGVRKYIAVFGHGSTELGQILSIYEQKGLVKTFNVRNEVEGAHCATMLKWHYGETAAVVTSIGPGALHAYAASLVPASNGIGVYHIYGDETTHDEGPNMQQIPGERQHAFLTLVETMGRGYVLHTPEAIFSALRKGAVTVFHPFRAGPFFFLAPMNTQGALIEECNLLELPSRPNIPAPVTEDPAVYEQAAGMIRQAAAVTIKFGGGARGCGAEICELAELADAVIVSGAGPSGVVPYSHPRFMGVGGSKGSICGNYAMANADLAIVIGARAVCQWDSSGTAWEKARAIVNFNADPVAACHYNRSLPILGDAKGNLRRLIEHLRKTGSKARTRPSSWLEANQGRKREWEELKRRRFDNPLLADAVWKREVLTQPAAIKIAYDFARERKAACYFDAGDVQANGFQLAEDEQPGLTFSETGASYMGFAVSAVLASGIADHPVYTFAFSGDGSLIMNPQILLDGVEHGARGCLIIFDNRRMAAITGLQVAQYGREYKTADSVQVDYVALAASVKGVRALFGGFSPQSFRQALEQAYVHQGLSLIHLPVYAGDHELGGLGVYGSWNVGNWCGEVQARHHRLGL